MISKNEKKKCFTVGRGMAQPRIVGGYEPMQRELLLFLQCLFIKFYIFIKFLLKVDYNS